MYIKVLKNLGFFLLLCTLVQIPKLTNVVCGDTVVNLEKSLVTHGSLKRGSVRVSNIYTRMKHE